MERPSVDKIRSSQESNVNGVIKGRYTDPIPLELLFIVFLKLPAKTLARCVCVSKRWASVIRSQDFIISFQSQSRILFFIRDYHQTRFENWFFSSNQQGTSSFLSRTTCHVSNSRSRCRQPQEVNGLICCGYGTSPVIYNPSSGKSLTLPRIYLNLNVGPYVENILGYDPINEEYKVLSMTPLPGNHSSDSIIPYKEHKVFTLGSQGVWRMVECNTIHCPGTISVCINGVVYYGAYVGESMKQLSLVRFDVRTEKFGFMKMPESVQILSYYSSTLMNYHGKIALAYSTGYDTYELWVLEDAKEHEWSKMCFSTRAWTQPCVKFEVEGVTRMGEIILTPRYGGVEFYVVYYNLVTKQFRKIGIEGYKNPGGVVVSWEYVEKASTMLL
ncbi:F-box protein [Raphanus sativus]|uniref:F-box protein At4g11590-like n=1 Tax=Raphanus sativus TaxID=3726 RepID=A0A6J0M6Q5_RAPSA|nr:F-box protein At4g11590-like [Raphanus sativus]KAJ4912062.1 F-box protein [Raphanus sativus]